MDENKYCKLGQSMDAKIAKIDKAIENQNGEQEMYLWKQYRTLSSDELREHKKTCTTCKNAETDKEQVNGK